MAKKQLSASELRAKKLAKLAMATFATKNELSQAQQAALASEQEIRAIVSGYSQSSNSNQE